MEKYRNKIKSNIMISIIIVVSALCLNIFNLLINSGRISIKIEDTRLLDFQAGLLSGIAVIALILIYRYSKALKSPDKLKELYNTQNDERKSVIKHKAGLPMIAITSCIMIFAGIIAGYLNTIVFCTLIFAAVIQLILALAVKSYFMKTM